MEASFRAVSGVVSVTSGYAGGNTTNPSYDTVSGGLTGHAEVVKIDYEPQKVSYEELLKLFFILHDPSQLNRQGNDIGTQYRSIILYADEEEKREILQYIDELLALNVHEKIVTEVVPLTVFYPAEEYHQDYFAKHPDQAYCQLVVRPKVDKVLKMKEADGGKTVK